MAGPGCMLLAGFLGWSSDRQAERLKLTPQLGAVGKGQGGISRVLNLGF